MADCSMLMLVGYGLGISTLAVVYALKKLKVIAVIKDGLDEIKLNNEAKELAFKKAKKEVLMVKMEQKNKELKELKKAVLGKKKVEEEATEEEEEEPEVEEQESEPKPKPKKVKEIKKQEPKKELENKVQDIEIEGMN